MTLALPKAGLKNKTEYTGELYLADISIPPALYSHSNLKLSVGHIFAQEEIIRLR